MKNLLKLALLFLTLTITGQEIGDKVVLPSGQPQIYNGYNWVIDWNALSSESTTSIGNQGLSAYEVWLNIGNVGTEQDFINSLQGVEGAQGDIGITGQSGLSAYQIALNNGFVGTEQEWLESLVGSSPPTILGVYQESVDNGYTGTSPEFWSKFIELLNTTNNTTNPDTRKTVVITGASIMQEAFAASLNNTNDVMMTKLQDAGIDNVDFYGYGFGGETIEETTVRVSEIIAKFPDAYIFIHTGGNNVSATRPLDENSSDFTEISELYDTIMNSANGTNAKLIFANLTFRTYRDYNIQDSLFDVDEDRGSKPYNDLILVPKITANFPNQINSDGNPKVDFYNLTRNNYKGNISTDGIHWVDSTVIQDYIVQQVGHFVNGDPVVSPIPRSERPIDNDGLSILNIGADGGSAVNEFSEDFLTSEEITTLINSELNDTQIDVTGRLLGGSLSRHFGGNNSSTAITSFDGTIDNSVIYTTGFSIEAGLGNGLEFTFDTKQPNASYELGFVGSWDNAQERAFEVLHNGISIAEVITSTEVGELPTYADVISDENGLIVLTMQVSRGDFSSINGISIEKIESIVTTPETDVVIAIGDFAGFNTIRNADYSEAIPPVIPLLDSNGDDTGITITPDSNTDTANSTFNNGGGDFGSETFDNTLENNEIYNSSIYVFNSIDYTYLVEGLTPNTVYNFSFCGSRIGTTQIRSALIVSESDSVEIFTSDNPPLAPVSMELVSDANGAVLLTQTLGKGTFGYLGGIRIQNQ